MKLLDTNIWFKWFWNRPLPGALEKELSTGELALSPISVLEVAYLLRKGKVRGYPPLNEWLEQALAGFRLAPLTPEIAAAAGSDSWTHQDPGDRVLVHTALANNYTLVHSDRVIKARKDVRQAYFTVLP